MTVLETSPSPRCCTDRLLTL